jgi:hypothetical protein
VPKRRKSFGKLVVDRPTAEEMFVKREAQQQRKVSSYRQQQQQPLKNKK